MWNLYTLSANITFYLLIIFFFITHKFLSTNLRNKVIYFIATIVGSCLWGFFFNLDGLMLILITTELTAILLLIMTYTQLLLNITFTKPAKFIGLFYLVFLVAINTKTSLVGYVFVNYYCGLSEIIATDFFILYQILFTDFIEITGLLILIISFFSIFFILLYFNLKLSKTISAGKNSQIFCLRKQVVQKQTKFNTKLAIFQN